MSKILIKISALVLGLALAGCSMLPEENLQDKGREIKFTASVGSFKVKATDTAFELGDQIGLFADAPVNANNVRMRWDGANLIPETSLFWAPGDESQVSFSAYYPYSPDKERFGQFFVNADQSTHQLFTQSDFMTASSSVFSTDGVVNLEFFHRFSKIVIHLDNRLQDLSVADVFVGNIRGRVDGDVWGYYSVIGNPGTIKAGKAVTPEGESVWALIIPSQSCRPQLMITTTDGKQFTYEPEWDIMFDQSRSYNAHVTMDGGSIFTDFTSQVTEWTDNNDLAFPMPGQSSWTVTGTSSGELPLHNCQPGQDVYYGLIYYESGQELSFIRDGSIAYGYSTDGNGRFVADGERIKLQESGVYEVFIYPADNRIDIAPGGGTPSWGVTGTLEWMNWNRDHYADFTTVTYQDGVPYPVFGYRIKYHVGEQFKFRFRGEWNMEFGYPELWWNDTYSVTVPAGEYVSLMFQGSNISLPEDGRYEVYLDVYNERMLAVKTEDLPPQAPSAIRIDGDFSDWDQLNPDMVSVAYGVPGSDFPALKVMKAYAEAGALFVYFEFDSNYITPSQTYLDIYLNTDNLPETGYSSKYWWNAGVDYFLEKYIYLDGRQYNYDGHFYAYAGENMSEEWNWERLLLSGHGASYGVWNGCAYEIVIDRDYVPFNDSFGLGIHLMNSNWEYVGTLPDRTGSNPSDVSLLPVNVGGPGVQMGDPNAVAPVLCNSVADAVFLEDDTTVKIQDALVYAVSTRGFVVWDGPDSGSPALFVYHGYMPEGPVSIGDRVDIRGTKVTYRGVPEITNTGLSFRVVSSGNGIPQIYYQDLTDQLDNYPPYSVPGSFKGVLSGTTVTCGESGSQGSLYWPFEPLSALEGATIRVTGFTFYNYNGLSTLVSDHIRVLDLPVESLISDAYYGEDGKYYKVSGTVTSISSTRYGNYTIKDDTGMELVIYGTVSEWGYYPLDGVNWDGVTLEQAGVRVGSKVTVVGPKTTYSGTPELVDVILVDAVPGEPPFDPSQDPNYSRQYDWNFSTSEWVDAFYANFTDGPGASMTGISFTVNGLTVEGGDRSMRFNFRDNTYFIQTGGRGDEYGRYLSFDAPAAGNVYVWVTNTAGAEALDRMAAVNQNGAVQELPGGYSAASDPVMLTFPVVAGNVKIYPSVNALRFYRVLFVEDGSEPVVPPDSGHGSLVWDFSSEAWQSVLSQYGDPGTDIVDWDITFDGLQFYSNTKCKYNTTYIQTGGRGSLDNRFFRFTAPASGTLSVWVTNTGSVEDLSRVVTVYTSDTCYQEQPGGYPSSGGPVQVVFEDIPAGELKIYPSVNALRFYKIQFDY